jgi:hypothetical protein
MEGEVTEAYRIIQELHRAERRREDQAEEVRRIVSAIWADMFLPEWPKELPEETDVRADAGTTKTS